MPMKLLKYMLKETESNVNDTIVMFQWRVRKQKYGVGLFGEVFLMCQWKKGDNGQAVTIFCSPEHRINDSKPSLCHHLPEKCFSFSNRALVCSTFVLSHRSAGKKIIQNNKTKHGKDRWTLFSTSAWWERCHTATEPCPAHVTAMLGQSGLQRMHICSSSAAPNRAQQAEMVQKCLVWSASIPSTTARTKIKVCKGW